MHCTAANVMAVFRQIGQVRKIVAARITLTVWSVLSPLSSFLSAAIALMVMIAAAH